MPDRDDELMRLRAADPVDRASLPSARGTEANALFERIIMSMHAEGSTTVSASRYGRRIALAGAAAVVAVAAVIAAIAMGGGGATQPDVATGPTTPGSSDGAISPGESSMGLCAEVYDLSTLESREYAFDGTVSDVDGDRITFAVNEWFNGGDSDQVALGGASTLAGVTSVGATISLEPGTRLLVAGDGGFAWSCGFTQPFDPVVADQWRQALAA